MTQFNSLYYASVEPPLINACNGRTAPYNTVSGENSLASHTIHLVSAPLTNIIKVSFLEAAGDTDENVSYHDDFYQGYDPTVSRTDSTVGFSSDWQTPKYTIKQINKLGAISATGQCVRWVAGDINNISDAYIQKTSGNFTTEGADAGMLYQTDATTSFSTAWGSSIKEISILEGVYRFDVPELNSSLGTNEPSIPYNYGAVDGTGTLTPVKIRKVNPTSSDPDGVVVATGYVFAVKTQGTQYGPAFLYTQILTGVVPYSTTAGSQNPAGERQADATSYSDPTQIYFIESEKLEGNGNPCWRYQITQSMRYDVGSNVETFKRVDFYDPSSSGPEIDVTLSSPYNTVFQYQWDNFLATNIANKIEAIPYAFVPLANGTALYIDECIPNESFEIRYGGVYQYDGTDYVSWGNRGIVSTASQVSDPKRGRFVNIAHSPTNPLYGDVEIDYIFDWENGGENLIQTLSRTLSYDSNYNYVPGEKIFQVRSNEDYDYSSATVISWEFPSLQGGTKYPMILVAKIDKKGPRQPGDYLDILEYQDLQPFRVGGLPEDNVGSYVYGGRIIPSRLLSSTDILVEDWPYITTGTNVFFTDNKIGTAGKDANGNAVYTYTKQDESPLPVTVGTTRIRAVSLAGAPNSAEQADVLYKYYLFDTQLTESNSIFSDVTDVSYDDLEINGNTRKTIFKIAPISGRRETQEIVSGTSQTVTTRKTVIFEPSKDKLFFKLPTGKVFESVLSQPISVELQKIFTHTFNNSSEVSWAVGSSDDVFLASEPNINWFAVDADTGISFNLVNGTSPSYTENQLGYVVTEDGKLTIYAPSELASSGSNITLFTKTIKTFDENSIRKKTLKVSTEIITGLIKGTSKSTKDQYYAELMLPSNLDSQNLGPGVINSIISIYPVDLDGNLVTGMGNVISSFVLDTGITDQKISRPKIILGPAFINNGKLDKLLFGSSDPTTVSLQVTYEYYEFDNEAALLSTRESFIDGSGNIISNFDVPFYFSSSDGAVIHESAILDFRPHNLSSTDSDFYLTSGDITTKLVPHPDWADEILTSYYLPRKDKLILTKDGKFEVLYGKPNLSPRYPSDVPNSMSLYLIDKDPYIFGPSSVKMKMIDNRRYTMRDIGKIEKRVQKLEYYTTLSILEKKAEDMLVLDANGNNRFKNGILVDTFEGHKVGDVTHRDYNIAMDFNSKYARSPFKTYSNNFILDPNGSTSFVGFSSQENGVYSDLFMLPYSEVVFVAQPLATRAITVQPHDTIQYEGIVDLIPSLDNWVSTTRRPSVNVNLAGENDAWNQMVAAFNNNNLAPFGTQWEEWDTLSRSGTRTLIDSDTVTRIEEDWHLVKPGHAHGGTGVGREERTIENITTNTFLVSEQLEQIRNGMTRTLSTSTTDISLGDRVVDVRLVPFMREKNIKIFAKGLKPRTRVYVFFDGINVEEYCFKHTSISGLYGLSAQPQALLPFPGSELDAGIGGISFGTGASEDLKTDENGSMLIEFRMPDGMFRVGDRKLEITSDVRNNKERATTYASAVYSASGLRTEVEETIATTRNFQISDPVSTTENRTIDTVGTITESSSNFVVQTRQKDPLAQTFFVDPAQHPEGIFLSSVDIFFARKPEDTTKLPVQIQIRPVVNGYPDSTRIYPGGKVVKMPEDIQVSEDASVASTFQFQYPIHLPPGEHALIVKGDTSEYEIFIATLGDFILGTETKVTNQPYVGVFFTSANASTWSAEQNTDMMFVLNKCEFQTTSKQLVLKNEVIDTLNNFELLNINSRYFDFNSCRSNWNVTIQPFEGSQVSFPVEPNLNVELEGTYSYGTTQGSTPTEKPLRLTISAATSNKDVSPVIDLQSLGFFAVNNLIESNDASGNGELDPYVPGGSVNGIPRARYISRVVTLEDGFDSSNMKVVLSVNKPVGTNIQVFAKTQDSESTDDFHSFGYTRLTPNVDNFDTYYTENPNDFREIEFQMSQDTVTPYNKFCVKICLYSTKPWNVPKVRDLRAAAVL